MTKPLYERDFHAWTLAQADALRRRSANELDWENLQEEIESMGKSEVRQLHRRLAILIGHILKWKMQPDLRSRSWVATILVQQQDIRDLIADSPSLKARLGEVVSSAHDEARELAAVEMGRLKSDCERQGSFEFDELMSFDPDLSRD